MEEGADMDCDEIGKNFFSMLCSFIFGTIALAGAVLATKYAGVISLLVFSEIYCNNLRTISFDVRVFLQFVISCQIMAESCQIDIQWAATIVC